MEITKENKQSVEIVLKPEDVESAIRLFIHMCEPEYAKGWLLNAKYNLGTVVFAGTKDENVKKCQNVHFMDNPYECENHSKCDSCQLYY